MVKIKNKKDSRLIRALLDRLDVTFESKNKSRKLIPKSTFASHEDFLSFSGSMKGQLVSKKNLRDLSWKKRSW